MIKKVLPLTKKEFNGYLNNPSLYIVVAVFLVIWEFLFFRSSLLVGEASLRGLYDLMPWLMLILVPAVTMGVVAKEREDGTLELILTHPIRELHLILGKFFGALLFVSIPLFFVLPIAYSFSQYASMDFGIVAGQIIGGILFAACLVALGIFASSLFSSQITSLITSVALSFVFILIGTELITAVFPVFLSNTLEGLSLLSHVQSTARGVLDLRDALYFLSFIIVFLNLSWLQLIKRKYGNRKDKYKSFQFGSYLLISITVLISILGTRIPGRLDLTQDRIYTLSEGTKNNVKSLNDIVNISLYYSELPAQYSPILRETRDLLRDYQKISNGKINVKISKLSNNANDEQEAVSLGIAPIQFNTLGQEKFESQKGYLGLVVSYAGKNEAIPFISSTGDLEYQLTSFIKKLTSKDKKKVGFLSGHEEKSVYSDYGALNNELQKQYEIVPISINEEEDFAIDKDVKVLIIASPKTKISEKSQEVIKRYLSQGGSLFILAEGYDVDPQTLVTQESLEDFSWLLGDFDVKINKDFVYDLQLSETISYGGDQGFTVLTSYPLWVKSITKQDVPAITFKINSVSLPWVSSISSGESKKDYEIKKLLETSPNSGLLHNPVSLTPDQTFSRDNLKTSTLAIAIENEKVQGDEASEEKKGNIVLVGDSDFLVDGILNRSPENLVFGINSISWLTQEESLANIKIKERVFDNLVFKSDSDPLLIKYGNLALAVAAPLLFGLIRNVKRKRLKNKAYK